MMFASQRHHPLGVVARGLFTAVMVPSTATALQLSKAPKECEILGGTFGYIVQGLLFMLCCSVLLVKWRMEVPQRTLKVFMLDSSKQFVGAGVIHVLNMVCATIFSSQEHATADQCAWYWVNIMIDTTLGVLICFALLKATEKIFGYESGKYGKKAETGIDWEKNPDYTTWGKQIAVWCGIVCMMKGFVIVLMWAFHSFWEWASIACTHWISNRRWRLVFVMIVTPTCMNAFQFWVQDTFLKYKEKKAPSSEKDDKASENAPLVPKKD